VENEINNTRARIDKGEPGIIPRNNYTARTGFEKEQIDRRDERNRIFRHEMGLSSLYENNNATYTVSIRREI